MLLITANIYTYNSFPNSSGAITKIKKVSRDSQNEKLESHGKYGKCGLNN